jgi:adenylate cyclase
LVATFFLWQRRLDPALECAETAHEVAEEQSIVQWQAWAEIIIGNALAGKGQLQEGLSWIQKGREAINTIRSQLALMVLTPTIAQAYCFCGEYAEGLELIEQVKSTLRQTGIGEGVSEIHRLRGNLLAASGATTDQIEAAYREGLKLARTQEAKMLELRAATDLARLWQINGKNADAYELLAPIHGWFTEGFDTADLMDAKALIDELA